MDPEQYKYDYSKKSRLDNKTDTNEDNVDSIDVHALAYDHLRDSITINTAELDPSKFKLSESGNQFIYGNVGIANDDDVTIYNYSRDNMIEELKEKIESLKADLKIALDLKLETLPVMTSGVYKITIPVDIRNSYHFNSELLQQLKESIDNKYGTDSNILLVNFNLEDITDIHESAIDEEIQRLENLKKEIKEKRKFI